MANTILRPLADDDPRLSDEVRAARLAATLKGSSAPAAPQRNFIAAGVSSGIDQLQALSGRGIQALGDATGLQPVSDVGKDIADRNFAEAAANGRPDLEARPDLAHWTDYPAWAGYQAAKQLPTLAASLIAYKLGGSRLAGAIPEELAAAGASAPKFMGGGGLRAGASALEAKAAQEQGARMAAGIISQAPVVYPQSVGSMYDEAVQSGTDGKAAARKALGLGVPYSLLEGFEPGALSGMVEKGLAGGLIKRAATGSLVGAATETLTEGVQTGMEQSFRPDLSTRDKISNIVEGAIAGGVIGGLFGGFSGVVGGNSHIKRAPPNEVTTSELKDTVNKALGMQGPPVPAAVPSANGQMIMPGLDARAAPAGSPKFMGGVEPAPDFTAGTQTNITNYPIQPAGENFDRAVQGPFQSSPSSAIPAPLVQGPEVGGFRRQFPYDTYGAARWARYQDIGGRSAQQIAQERMAAEGPVTADTSVEPRDPNQLTMDLVDPKTKAALLEQRAPAYDPVAEKADIARRQTIADQIGTKAKWAAPIIDGAQDQEDVATGLQQLLDHYDSQPKKKAPDGLVKAAVKNGLLDENGTPRDFKAEVNEASAKNDALWKRANDTGTKQDLTKAQKFQTETLKPLTELAATVENARKRVADLQARQAAEAPTGERPSTAAEAAAVLRNAPPVAPLPNLQQTFARRGVAPALTEAPAGVAAPDVAPAASEAPVASSVDPTEALKARWSAGKVQMTANPQPSITVPTDPVVPTNPLAQGSRFTPGTETAPIAEPTKYVMKQDRAKASRRAKADAVAPAPVTAALAQGTSFTPDTSAADRAAKVQQRLATVANDTTLDEFPHLRGLRAAAVAAAAEHTKTGSEANYHKVMADYTLATGGMVTSRRSLSDATPPMQASDYEAAFRKATSKMPVSARANVVSVATEADLPPEVLHAAEAQGLHPGEIRGVLYEDKAYVVQEHISSEAQLQEVVDHEVWGHGAARALFGDQRIATMSTTFDQAGGLEGVLAIARKYGVESTLRKYLPGNPRDLTVNDKAAFVDELVALAAGKTTGKFSQLLRAWMSQFKNGLIRVLNNVGLTTAAARLDKFDANDLAAMLVRGRAALQMGKSMAGDEAAFLRNTPQGLATSAKNIMDSMSNFDKLMEKYNASSFSDNFNRFHLYSSTTEHIAQFFGKPFMRADGTNMLQDWVDALHSRTVTNQLLAHMHRQTLLRYEDVHKNDPKASERVGNLMGASYNEMDPRKSWDEHTWLHKLSNAEQLKTVLAKHNADYNWLRQNSPRFVEQGIASPLKVYEDMIHSNEMQHYAQQALSLYNIMMRDGQVAQALKDKITNPMTGFLADAAQHSVPMAAKMYWLGKVNDLKKTASEYVAEQKGAMSTAGKVDADNIKSRTSTLIARVEQINDEHKAMAKAPYFHIGRFGDYVLKFNIRKGANGQVDPAAYERIAKALADAKIENVVIPTELQDVSQSNVFIRFENKGSWTEGVKLAHALQKEGVALKVEHFDAKDEAKAGSISQLNAVARDLMRTIQATSFGGSDLQGADKKLADKINQEFKHHLTQFFLNQLPDVATNKVMMHRNYVAGFSPDNVRAYVQRSLVGSRSLATLHASTAIASVSAEMTNRADEMRSGEDMHDGLAAQRTINELFTREAQRPAYIKSDFVDAMRATTHTAFLGLSPGYIATQLTSLGTTLWPELSKKFGFVQSAKAIGKVTPQAMNIIRQTVLSGKQSGWRNMADATITREVLEKAGVKGAQADFIMKLVNSGVLDIGTQSRELGSIAEGTENSRTDTLLRYGSAAGYYSEMLTRLVAALSARELHGGYKDDMFKYAVNTVNQSMFTFSADNMARAVGRQGIIGRYTPLVAQFQSYMFMVTEKLMREIYTGFRDAAATPAQKKEARRFMLAHLTAMTTLTGTLGLPMAAVFAKVLDKAVDWSGADDDDEPFNSQVALRNWLNDTFGASVGNVLARGAPHALGFDISKRVGEQDLLPFIQTFSKLLTSRRQWKDAIPEWLDSTAGSSVGFASNVLQGGDLVMSGRYLDGFTKMSPTAIAGPLKAWQLSRDGYVDSSGNRQPMSPSALDYFYQAMGFNPAAKADVAEANAAQASLKSDMAGRASVLRRDLVMSLERRDMNGAQAAYMAAQAFDEKHPDYAILPHIAGTLKRRASDRAKAEAAGTPLGVRPTQGDTTRFFNPANY